MKKFAMTIAASITLAPALIFSNSIIFSNFIIILIAIWLCWILTEFYIGITRPCQGTEPKQPLLMISRMFWLFFVIYSWVDIRYHWSTAEFPPWFLAILLVLCSAGLLIRIWAVIHLGKSFSYDVKKPEAGKFIKTGPYRFTRHPAYLGILILGSLPGLILGSIPGFVGMLLTTLVPVIIRAKSEDELLEAEFGEDYIKYKKSTFGIIPFIY
ncbi:MAG: Isoprenylcysteine carboxyl methyltransferase [Nitrospirae bacterium]|nr:MAG: Isoprenylcysteine carboxyl methyltransferase [Nitrospirota bacterium]